MSQEKKERIFISYKRVDKERVFAIKDGIEQATGEKCWIDLDGIESDAQFADVIISAINRCEVFLFMYSASHTKIVNRKKDWTIREISFAEKKDKRIVFVNIDNSPLTDWFELNFGTTQQVDATDTEKLAHLHNDLCSWLKIDIRKKTETTQSITLEDVATQELLLNDQVRESLPETKVREIVKFVLTADGISSKYQERFVLDLKYGLATAQNNLGFALEDPKKKVKWIEKAADSGSAAAMLNLGKMYAYGEGIEKNMNKALDYFRKASAIGYHDEAAHYVNRILDVIGEHEDQMAKTRIGNLFYEVVDKNLTDLKVVPHESYKKMHVITIPEKINRSGVEFTIKKIDAYAFANNTSLQAINLPNSLETIGNNAFENCSSLSSLVLPNSIQAIGDEAFKWCSSLKYLEIPSDLENTAKKNFYDYYLINRIYQPSADLTPISIVYSAFYGCSSINSLTLKSCLVEDFCKARGNDLLYYQYAISARRILKINNVECPSVFVPKEVNYIGRRNFYNCEYIESIVLPNTIKSIECSAFEGCISLASISFDGTKQQWDSIKKGEDWNKSVLAKIVHCTDGDVEI
jgi:hypothetical protein